MTTHGTSLLRTLLSNPRLDAMHMEGVVAFTHDYFTMRIDYKKETNRKLTQRAFFARIPTLRTGAIVWISTYAANIIFRHIPAPCCYGIPLLYDDAHVEQK